MRVHGHGHVGVAVRLRLDACKNRLIRTSLKLAQNRDVDSSVRSRGATRIQANDISRALDLLNIGERDKKTSFFCMQCQHPPPTCALKSCPRAAQERPGPAAESRVRRAMARRSESAEHLSHTLAPDPQLHWHTIGTHHSHPCDEAHRFIIRPHSVPTHARTRTRKSRSLARSIACAPQRGHAHIRGSGRDRRGADRPPSHRRSM